MAKQYSEINTKLQTFIKEQKIFFVGTAAADGRINVSPKGMDTFRVVNQNKVLWLNLTGSGNETAAHLFENDRITIMFCSFEGDPLILRLYGHARPIHPRDREWDNLISLFPSYIGARQVIEMDVDLVQTSCGFAVPYFNFAGDRDFLDKWAKKTGKNRIEKYWEKSNQISLDGKPTGIVEK